MQKNIRKLYRQPYTTPYTKCNICQSHTKTDTKPIRRPYENHTENKTRHYNKKQWRNPAQSGLKVLEYLKAMRDLAKCSFEQGQYTSFASQCCSTPRSCSTKPRSSRCALSSCANFHVDRHRLRNARLRMANLSLDYLYLGHLLPQIWICLHVLNVAKQISTGNKKQRSSGTRLKQH